MTNEEAHLVARVINACSYAGVDSGGWEMVKLRQALIAELQRALGASPLDPNAPGHTVTAVYHALRR